jgi:hypothetical protein
LRQVLEVQVQSVFGLHRLESAAVKTEWVAVYVLTKLRKMSSSDSRQTLIESRIGSPRVSLPLVVCALSQRVRI